jgi:glycerophosphoryl diester phosphodiesterase
MSAPTWLTTRPIAHRGFHDTRAGRPENTLAAASAAIAGRYAIECDVRLSADGEVMVFHDRDLARLTGVEGRLEDRNAAELAALPVLGTAERIPTLTALLGLVAGRVPVVVELKSAHVGDESLPERVVDVLNAYEGPVAVESFDPVLVRAVRRLAPSLPRGIVGQASYHRDEAGALPPATRHAMANLLHWDETRPDFLSWRAADLPAAAPFLARRLGRVPVTAWTVRSRAEADRVRPHADAVVFEGFVPA